MSEQDDLRKLAVQLTEMYIDSMVRAEAVRVMLEERGLFENADFQATYQRLKAIWDEKLKALRAAAQTADMRRILEQFEGKPQ